MQIYDIFPNSPILPFFLLFRGVGLYLPPLAGVMAAVSEKKKHGDSENGAIKPPYILTLRFLLLALRKRGYAEVFIRFMAAYLNFLEKHLAFDVRKH